VLARGEIRLSKKSRNLQAVILAGGMGTRLRPYTFLLPKPMLPVGSRPIIEHIIAWLSQNSVNNLLISVGYLGRIIEQYLGDGRQIGVKIEYARSDGPLGIAGQLKSAEPRLSSRFLCVYGDAILSFDLGRLVSFHQKKRAIVTMAVMEYMTHLKYGFIDTNREGRVEGWREKPSVTGAINIGCYVMEKEFLNYIPRDVSYGMKEAFDAAFKKGEPVFALKVKGEFHDIGDRKSYKEANEVFLKRMGKLY
jgi:mannose-1-phosphate guanylyltransferase